MKNYIMRSVVTIILLILVLVLAGCSVGRQEVRTENRPEVREISLTSGGEVTYTSGHGGSDTVTFWRDGTAEMRSEMTEHFKPQPVVVKRAQFSTDRFERLAKVFEDNGFFEKNANEGNIQDAWQNLKVVTSTGEKTIHTLGSNDPQIRAMVDAVNKLSGEVQWEDAK